MKKKKLDELKPRQSGKFMELKRKGCWMNDWFQKFKNVDSCSERHGSDKPSKVKMDSMTNACVIC